jgi:hypothetical protein
MKVLKVIIIALVTVFTFSAAEAQVRVRATIGDRPHRTVVVRRGPVYHRRTVVVRHRPVYHHRYRRPHYRRHY